MGACMSTSTTVDNNQKSTTTTTTTTNLKPIETNNQSPTTLKQRYFSLRNMTRDVTSSSSPTSDTSSSESFSPVHRLQMKQDSMSKFTDSSYPPLPSIDKRTMGLNRVDPENMIWIDSSVSCPTDLVLKCNKDKKNPVSILVTFHETPYSRCRLDISLNSTLDQFRQLLNSKHSDFLKAYDIEGEDYHFVFHGNKVSKEEENKKRVKSLLPKVGSNVVGVTDGYYCIDTSSETNVLNVVYIEKSDCDKRSNQQLFEDFIEYIKDRNYTQIVKLLVEDTDTVLPILQDVMGRTLLHYACLYNNLYALQVLVECGACLNSRTTTDGWTPLHVASSRGHSKIVEHLLKYGANPSLTDTQDRSPIFLAASSKHFGVFETLSPHPEVSVFDTTIHSLPNVTAQSLYFTEYPLSNILKRDDISELKRIMDLKICSIEDIELSEQNIALTIYHECVLAGSIKIIQFLLQQTKDSGNKRAMLTDNGGKTPLHFAAKTGNISIAKTLLGYLQDSLLEVRDDSGRTPLLTAFEFKKKEMALYLIEQGASITVSDFAFGFSAIHYAVADKYYELLKKIVTLNPEMAVQQNIIKKRVPIFKFRTVYREPEEQSTTNGPLPIIIAIQLNDQTSVNILLEHTGQRQFDSQIDSTGRTVIQYCIDTEAWDTLKLILSKYDSIVINPLYLEKVQFSKNRDVSALELLYRKTQSTFVLHNVAADGWRQGVESLVTLLKELAEPSEQVAHLFIGALEKKRVGILEYLLSQKLQFTFDFSGLVKQPSAAKVRLANEHFAFLKFRTESTFIYSILNTNVETIHNVLVVLDYFTNHNNLFVSQIDLDGQTLMYGEEADDTEEPTDKYSGPIQCKITALQLLMYIAPSATDPCLQKDVRHIIEIASSLIDRMSIESLDQTDLVCKRAVLIAAYKGYWKLVEQLISKQVNMIDPVINDNTYYTVNILEYVCINGGSPIASMVLSKHPELITTKCVENAANNQHKDIVQLLIQSTPTPLPDAAEILKILAKYDISDSFSLLFTRGVFSEQSDDEKNIITKTAVRSGSIGVITYLLETVYSTKEGKYKLLELTEGDIFDLVYRGRHDAPLLLLQHLPELRFRKVQEHSLLSAAAISGKLPLLKALLTIQSDVTGKNSLGYSPLDYARLYGNSEAGLLLSEYVTDEQRCEITDISDLIFDYRAQASTTKKYTGKGKHVQLQPVTKSDYVKLLSYVQWIEDGHVVSDTDYSNILSRAVSLLDQHTVQKLLTFQRYTTALVENPENLYQYLSSSMNGSGKPREQVATTLLQFIVSNTPANYQQSLKELQVGQQRLIEATCSRGYTAMLQLYLDSVTDDDLTSPNEEGLTVFDCALQNGQEEAMKLLINKGLAVNNQVIDQLRYKYESDQLLKYNELTSLYEPVQ
jgi:ankyrin repeat protein